MQGSQPLDHRLDGPGEIGRHGALGRIELLGRDHQPGRAKIGAVETHAEVEQRRVALRANARHDLTRPLDHLGVERGAPGREPLGGGRAAKIDDVQGQREAPFGWEV